MQANQTARLPPFNTFLHHLDARSLRGEGVLRQPTSRPQLRVIVGDDADHGDVVAKLDAANALRAEARDFEARNGKNPYSDFILKYGSRPNPEHAAALGRLLNKQVKASDGSLQPPLSPDQRRMRREERERRKKRSDLLGQISQLTRAIADLADLTAAPEDLVDNLGSVFDKPVIEEKLEEAIDSLSRFAEKWRTHEQGQIQGVT